MHVFVTGASGFVGSAVVAELLGAGHRVTGLARSDESAAALGAAGAAIHRGSLTELDGLRAAASAADGVAHLAYIHDFGDIAKSAEIDLRAVEAMGEVLAGKPFVTTSGTMAIPPGGVATEHDPTGDGAFGKHRIPSENATLQLAEGNVRSAVVRLSPSVHGEGDHGFVPMLIGTARDKGVSAYVGDGTNRWPTVHRLDAARLYRLALESAPAGARLHGVGEEGESFRDIAAVIGKHLGLPVVGISREEADAHFGFLAPVVAADCPASSAQTRDLLDWHPNHPSLVADLDEGHYFNEVSG